MQTVHVTRDFDVPVERLYAHLSVHENLGEVLGAKMTRIKEGATEPNGVGSVRKVQIGPLPAFEETITEADTNERIEYRITKGSPLRNHHGTMVFSSTGEGKSHLDYTINFGAVVPGLDAIVAFGLRRGIAKGLDKAAPKI